MSDDSRDDRDDRDEADADATEREDTRADAPMGDLARDRVGATDDDRSDRPGDAERDDSSPERAHDDRAEPATDEHEAEPATDDGDESDERTPLSDLAADVRERRERGSSDVESLFSEMDVGELDGERAWRDLLAADEDEPIAIGQRVETDEDRDVRIIENRTCHRCPYFADPPDFHCNHDGTEIRRVVDTDHFEVVDCPMVVDEDDLDIVGPE